MNRASARFWDSPSALLLTLGLLTASQRLSATNWTSNLGIVSLLALFGALLGLPLGFSRFRRGTVAAFSLLHTLIFVPFTLAGLLYSQVPWLERMEAMGGRLVKSLEVLATGQPLEDAFLFLALFSLGFWLISLCSACALTRSGSFPAAVLPAGVALIVIQVFDNQGDQGMSFLAIYIFLALFLLGRMNYARRQVSWQSWRVLPSDEDRANINLTVLAVAFVLVAAAWLFPVSQRNFSPLQGWWREVTRTWQKNENLTNVVASLETGRGPTVNDFYGNTLLLGQDIASNNTVLLRVQVTGVGGQERYYWRVRSYETYVNGMWKTERTFTRGFSPRTRSLELPGYEGVNAEFDFKVENTIIGSLVTPARPVWVSRPSILTFLPAGGEQVEPILFHVNEPLQPGEVYLVHAILMEPTLRQLQAAGTEYPAWVSDYYLQLPPDLPPAIADLARQVTAGARTPYEKAAAVTEYLRRTITYSVHVPPAPAERDALAWFLLDYKTGFCNYYASAEVVMLRSLGIPARLAVGFAEGEYQPPGWYTIRQRDTHAWPEVYFPGVGWVEFEPTSAQPEVARPSGEKPTPTAEATSVPVTPQAPGPQNIPPEAGGEAAAGEAGSGSGGGDALWMLMAFFGIVVLLGSLLFWAHISGNLEKAYGRLRSTFHAPASILARDWLEKNSLPVPLWLERRAWLAGLTPLGRAFMTVYRSLRRLRVPASPALTPAEAAATLAERLPAAGEETAALLGEYQAATYGAAPASLERAHTAARSLRRKTRRARWQNLSKHLHLNRKA